MNDKPFVMTQELYDTGCTTVLGKESALMCPKCYAVYKIRHEGRITATVISKMGIDLLVSPSYHIECQDCGASVQAVVLDPAIAECVSRLNRLGYKTVMCCSGHLEDKTNNAFIKFEKEYAFEKVPEHWKTSGVFLNAATNNRSRAIHSLSEWIESLEPHREGE